MVKKMIFDTLIEEGFMTDEGKKPLMKAVNDRSNILVIGKANEVSAVVGAILGEVSEQVVKAFNSPHIHSLVNEGEPIVEKAKASENSFDTIMANSYKSIFLLDDKKNRGVCCNYMMALSQGERGIGVYHDDLCSIDEFIKRMKDVLGQYGLDNDTKESIIGECFGVIIHLSSDIPDKIDKICLLTKEDKLNMDIVYNL